MGDTKNHTGSTWHVINQIVLLLNEYDDLFTKGGLTLKNKKELVEKIKKEFKLQPRTARRYIRDAFKIVNDNKAEIIKRTHNENFTKAIARYEFLYNRGLSYNTPKGDRLAKASLDKMNEVLGLFVKDVRIQDLTKKPDLSKFTTEELRKIAESE